MPLSFCCKFDCCESSIRKLQSWPERMQRLKVISDVNCFTSYWVFFIKMTVAALYKVIFPRLLGKVWCNVQFSFFQTVTGRKLCAFSQLRFWALSLLRGELRCRDIKALQFWKCKLTGGSYSMFTFFPFFKKQCRSLWQPGFLTQYCEFS